jgi:hypothetical protein
MGRVWTVYGYWPGQRQPARPKGTATSGNLRCAKQPAPPPVAPGRISRLHDDENFDRKKTNTPSYLLPSNGAGRRGWPRRSMPSFMSILVTFCRGCIVAFGSLAGTGGAVGLCVFVIVATALAVAALIVGGAGDAVTVWPCCDWPYIFFVRGIQRCYLGCLHSSPYYCRLWYYVLEVCMYSMYT